MYLHKRSRQRWSLMLCIYIWHGGGVSRGGGGKGRMAGAADSTSQIVCRVNDLPTIDRVTITLQLHHVHSSSLTSRRFISGVLMPPRSIHHLSPLGAFFLGIRHDWIACQTWRKRKEKGWRAPRLLERHAKVTILAWRPSFWRWILPSRPLPVHQVREPRDSHHSNNAAVWWWC